LHVSNFTAQLEVRIIGRKIRQQYRAIAVTDMVLVVSKRNIKIITKIVGQTRRRIHPVFLVVRETFRCPLPRYTLIFGNIITHISREYGLVFEEIGIESKLIAYRHTSLNTARICPNSLWVTSDQV